MGCFNDKLKNQVVALINRNITRLEEHLFVCCCMGRGCRVNSSVVPGNLLKLKLGILAATFSSHSWYLELPEPLLKLLFFFFYNLRMALKCRNFPLSVAHEFWLGAFSCVGFFFFPVTILVIGTFLSLDSLLSVTYESSHFQRTLSFVPHWVVLNLLLILSQIMP